LSKQHLKRGEVASLIDILGCKYFLVSTTGTYRAIKALLLQSKYRLKFFIPNYKRTKKVGLMLSAHESYNTLTYDVMMCLK
jgi:hypothetical protein